jgi:putative transposase
VKYAFIEKSQAQFPVLRLCQVLRVSRSGFYDWLGRPESKRSIRHGHLAAEIRSVHDQHDQNYGAVKCWKALRLEGLMVGRDQIANVRRKNDIYSKRRRRFVITTKSKQGQEVAQNILKREFQVAALNTAWVGDVTFIPTRKGWLYLAVLLDLCSRKVVGWSMRDRNDSTLVTDCLEMAIEHRKPPPGLVHHTDRGSTYTSEKYRTVLSDNGMVSSMSRKGNCWDNAVSESFFGSLKNELTHWKNYQNRDQARADIFRYIEIFYNRQRLHQTLDYVSPTDYEMMKAA